jgi:hypothetical protein
MAMVANKKLYGNQIIGAASMAHTGGRKPRDEWSLLLRDNHQGYISWREYEAPPPQTHDTDRRPASGIVYLTDVLTRIQSHPKDRLQKFLPWQWAPAKDLYEAA